MKMKMYLLSLPPSKIQNKAVSIYELQKYFDAKTIESLLLILQQGQSDGYFTFDITLSPKYLDWEEDHRKLLSGETENYKPIDLFTVRAYSIRVSDAKIKKKVPLTGHEIRGVVSALPSNMSEKYLLFTLRNLDNKKLREIVKPKINRTDKDEDFDMIEYNGLIVRGARITYLNEPIHMSFQHRQVVRLLLSNNGELCTKDKFTENPDIFTGDDYPNVYATLRKLIAEVRAELKTVIKKNCIKSVSNEGWYLEL
jgi:hypothetical protein